MGDVFKILSLLVMFVHYITAENVNGTLKIYGNEKSELLSRKKRFIVFPEGSSFQLVFCVTYSMVIEIGDIFLYGNTAALAWELPQDPYSPFDHHADPLHRRSDSKVIFYDEDGKILFKRPYRRKSIVNPAFAKRSVDSLHSERVEKETGEFKMDRKQMHDVKNRRAFLNGESLDSLEFHRTGRVSLYRKIETMLQGLGVNGKQCILKTLCIVGKTNHHPQGEFLQEILRAVFSFPKGATDELYKEYENAHHTADNCDILYPECDEPLMDSTSPILSH